MAYVADPKTGLAVYSSTNGGWSVVGETRAGRTAMGRVDRVADQQRLAAGRSLLATNNLTNSPFYSAAASDYANNFLDISTGQSGKSVNARAQLGYDFATGLGSPIANNLIPYLAMH